jgi:hypothetical protein
MTAETPTPSPRRRRRGGCDAIGLRDTVDPMMPETLTQGVKPACGDSEVAVSLTRAPRDQVARYAEIRALSLRRVAGLNAEDCRAQPAQLRQLLSA